jgi:hypothetical protein
MRMLSHRATSRITVAVAMAVVATVFTSAQPAYAGGGTVDVALVPRLAAGAVDQASTLPAAETAVMPGSTFVVEIWAQTIDPNGLSSISLDVVFSPNVSVTGVTHTTVFSALSNAVIDNPGGTIDDLSGSHLAPCTDQIGIDPQWARVAILDLSADAAGVAVVQSSSANSMVYGTAVCGVGDINPASITFGQASLLVGDLAVPTVSEWGFMVMWLLSLTAATMVWTRRKAAA